ncbi:DUF1642 domain-containing protein [Enterococcus raffinosus]|uniref:DUF1642 domain-containing protein n=1 Tax=Enterococcus raffinosus TaxID=71452 RepID=UPI003DA2C28C
MNKQEVLEKLEQKKETILRSQKNLLMGSELWQVYEARAATFMSAINIVEQLNEPQKVKVPKCVGELLDYYRNSTDVDLLALLITFKNWYCRKDKAGENENAIDWLVKHPEKYMRAWLDGYEVEEEPKYRVLFPCDKRKTGHQFSYLMEDGIQCYCSNLETIPELTESTIKSIDERYWPFAVPVEKV